MLRSYLDKKWDFFNFDIWACLKQSYSITEWGLSSHHIHYYVFCVCEQLRLRVPKFPIASFVVLFQGSHRLEKYLNLNSFLEKYLNLESFLEKSLKIISALKKYWKITQKPLKSLWILLFFIGLSTVDRDLNQYKIAVPLFGAAYAVPNKGTTILYSFSSTNVSIISV